MKETTDPYARACSANGALSMVVNLSLTNPAGWENDHGPELPSPTDAILYELHIRDLSMDPSSGIQNKGLFAGLTEHQLKLGEFSSTEEKSKQGSRWTWVTPSSRIWLSPGSACGNETASEHPMVRAFLVDSLAYWAKE